MTRDTGDACESDEQIIERLRPRFRSDPHSLSIIGELTQREMVAVQRFVDTLSGADLRGTSGDSLAARLGLIA